MTLFSPAFPHLPKNWKVSSCLPGIYTLKKLDKPDAFWYEFNEGECSILFAFFPNGAI
jgi:hypothetical protein